MVFRTLGAFVFLVVVLHQAEYFWICFPVRQPNQTIRTLRPSSSSLPLFQDLELGVLLDPIDEIGAA
jgi:hypothetical protein